MIDGILDRFLIQSLLIQHNIRLDDAAAGAVRDVLRIRQKVLCIIKFCTALTVVAMDASMQLQHRFTSRLLMQSIDILRHDCPQSSFLLHLRQLFVRCIRLHIQNQHFVPVKPVKFLWISFKKGMA